MIKGVVFDLDGTLYYGNELASDAQSVLARLREYQIDIFFITNNSTKSRDEIAQKLVDLGVPTFSDKVYCSASASVKFLLQQHLEKIFVVGSKSLENEVLSAGLQLSDPLECECILVGMDFDFTYAKINLALQAINQGALFIACNTDHNFLIENNALRPGCGAMVAAIQGASKRAPDFIIGKPEVNMIEQLLEDWNLTPNELFIIGDTYESDILMAENCSIPYAHLINTTVNTPLKQYEVKSLTEAINKILELV